MSLADLPADLLVLLLSTLDLQSLGRVCCTSTLLDKVCTLHDAELWKKFTGLGQITSETWRELGKQLSLGEEWTERWATRPCPSRAVIYSFVAPEHHCVCWCCDKIFLGAKERGEYMLQKQVPGLNVIEPPFKVAEYPKLVVGDVGEVVCLDSFDEMLAAGCNTTSDSPDGLIILFNAKTMKIEKKFVYPNATKEKIYATWQRNKVTAVKFAANGSLLFASSPGDKCDGVHLWDVKKEKLIATFNHRTESEPVIEPALYESRDADEIHGICPTEDGKMFLSGSYRYIYQWDVASKTMLRKIEFYPPALRPTEAAWWMNQESAYPLSKIGWTNPSRTLVSVIGTRKSKVQTYKWPSMEEIKLDSEFELPGEMECVHFSPWRSVAADIYGSYYFWDNHRRGYPVVINSQFGFTGSGTNGIMLHPSGEAVAWSAANPQSGWHGMTAGVATTEGEYFDPSDLKKRAKHKKDKEKEDDRGKCVLQ